MKQLFIGVRSPSYSMKMKSSGHFLFLSFCWYCGYSSVGMSYIIYFIFRCTYFYTQYRLGFLFFFAFFMYPNYIQFRQRNSQSDRLIRSLFLDQIVRGTVIRTDSNPWTLLHTILFQLRRCKAPCQVLHQGWGFDSDRTMQGGYVLRAKWKEEIIMEVDQLEWRKLTD